MRDPGLRLVAPMLWLSPGPGHWHPHPGPCPRVGLGGPAPGATFTAAATTVPASAAPLPAPLLRQSPRPPPPLRNRHSRTRKTNATMSGPAEMPTKWQPCDKRSPETLSTHWEKGNSVARGRNCQPPPNWATHTLPYSHSCHICSFRNFPSKPESTRGKEGHHPIPPRGPGGHR